jgi:hypothetical protein
MEETIFSTIRKEQDDFYNGYISVVPGYSFNQYETIKRAHLYVNSKYEDGSDYLGREKLFFNIVNPPREVATRMLNIDTKHIRLWPMNPKSHFSTYLLEKELKHWLKKSKFGAILNQIAEEAPTFGSVVLEKLKDDVRVVDIRKLINDPTVESLVDSRFVTVISYMTPTELRATGWDNVEAAIDKFSDTKTPVAFEDKSGGINYLESTPYIKVYKRYGEVPKKWLVGGESEEMVRAMYIVAGVDFLDENEKGEIVGELGEVMFKSRWRKEWPFKDFHYTKIKGRWLGEGVVEKLFPLQVRVNELKNQKRVSMELSSMHLFQTPDKQIVRNVLSDLLPGDVLRSPNGITPIANEERNLQAFREEEVSYSDHADRLTFAYEAVRGEPMPASMPATNALLANQQAGSVFAFKRENLTIFLQGFFNDLILDQMMKDLTPEHIMRFTGTSDEIARLDEAASELYANDKIKEMMFSRKRFNADEIEEMKNDKIKEYKKLGESRFVKIKENLYSDAEFEFDFLIGNEQADPATLIQNTQAVLSAVAGNPGILEDPRLKMLFYKYAEGLGISPGEIELAEAQASERPQHQQGQRQLQAPEQQIPQMQPQEVAQM